MFWYLSYYLISIDKFLPYIPVVYFLNFTLSEFPPQNPIVFLIYFKERDHMGLLAIVSKTWSPPLETHPQTEALLSAHHLLFTLYPQTPWSLIQPPLHQWIILCSSWILNLRFSCCSLFQLNLLSLQLCSLTLNCSLNIPADLSFRSPRKVKVPQCPTLATQVSHIAGGFFAIWATREAQISKTCWSF